jgi:hypothetical protein
MVRGMPLPVGRDSQASQELGPYNKLGLRRETRHGGHIGNVQHEVSHRQVPSGSLAPSTGRVNCHSKADGRECRDVGPACQQEFLSLGQP